MADITKGPGDLPGDNTNPNSPDYDGTREEWIEERADELLEERQVNPGEVSNALGYFFTLAAGDALEGALTLFYLTFPKDRVSAAEALFQLLDSHVSAALKARAEQDAENEWDAAKGDRP